jgi:hypothetical protein
VRDAARPHVRLPAYAVELVFDVELPGHRARHVLDRLGGGGEHELNRVEESHRDAFQTPAPRAHGRLADVAREHVDARHVRERAAERARHGVLDQPFLQADAQVSDEQLDEIFRLARRGRSERGGEQRLLVLRPARLAQGFDERLRGGERELWFRIRLRLGERLEGHVARVAEAHVARAQVLDFETRHPGDNIAQQTVADVRRPRVVEREDVPREVARREREVFVREPREVGAEQRRLFEFLRRRADGVGRLREAFERRAARRLPCLPHRGLRALPKIKRGRDGTRPLL